MDNKRDYASTVIIVLIVILGFVLISYQIHKAKGEVIKQVTDAFYESEVNVEIELID